jgi:hypothetical protein
MWNTDMPHIFNLNPDIFLVHTFKEKLVCRRKQQCLKVESISLSPHPCQHLLSPKFFYLSHSNWCGEERMGGLMSSAGVITEVFRGIEER